jgi:hypothetical protein
MILETRKDILLETCRPEGPVIDFTYLQTPEKLPLQATGGAPFTPLPRKQKTREKEYNIAAWREYPSIQS